MEKYFLLKTGLYAEKSTMKTKKNAGGNLPDQPLLRYEILLLREEDDANKSKIYFEKLGAKVSILPVIQFFPTELSDDIINELNTKEFGTVIFTSVNAVKFYLLAHTRYLLSIDLHDVFVAVIGNKTAEFCMSHDINVKYVAKESNAGSLAKELAGQGLPKGAVLLPHSQIARQELQTELMKNGYDVYPLQVYENNIPPVQVIEEALKNINLNEIDWIVFSSPSTFTNFLRIIERHNLGEVLESKKLAAIGTTTARTMVESGFKADVVPEKPGFEEVSYAIARYVSNIIT